MKQELEHFAQITLSRSSFISKIARKVSNQCSMIIGYHMAKTADGMYNGEFALAKAIAIRSKTFIDIGANHGCWTHWILSHQAGASMYLYEPNRACFKQLQTSFYQQDNIHISNCAISNFCGEANFVENENDQLGHIIPKDGSSNIIKNSVRVNTLDAEWPQAMGDVDFVKIDTEGSDLNVILGAKRLLSNGSIRYLQFEYTDAWMEYGANLRLAIQFLDSHGYDVYIIRPNRLELYNYSLWGDYFRYTNFLACRKRNFSAVEYY